MTGRIGGRIWSENINLEYEKYTGTVVLVQGRYTIYAGKPDLTIDKMEEALYYEVSDYIETISDDSKKRAFDWIGKIMSYIEGTYKNLADELLPAGRMEEIAGLPLSEKGAFSYIGGLLTYTSETAARTYYELRVASLVKCDISLALKTLEDGSAYSTVLLVCHDRPADTILSRCGILRFPEVDTDSIRNFFGGGINETALMGCKGAPGRYVRLSQDDRYLVS